MSQGYLRVATNTNSCRSTSYNNRADRKCGTLGQEANKLRYTENKVARARIYVSY